jgi:anaerobic glycerol-3-phosphate dehydrogenase
MEVNERQVALSVLENLREDLTYVRLNNGSRILDIADFRQYIYEQMARIRTNAHVTAALYGNQDGHGQDISKSNGHNGRVHP